MIKNETNSNNHARVRKLNLMFTFNRLIVCMWMFAAILHTMTITFELPMPPLR